MDIINLTPDELNGIMCIFSTVVSIWCIFAHIRTRMNRKADRKAVAKMVYECLDDETKMADIIYDFVKMRPAKFLKERH